MKTILHLLAAASTFALSAAAQGPSVLRHSIAPPPDVQAYENFGYSVATSGGFTAVGAPFHSGPGEDIGLVKVFNSATGALLHVLPNPDPHEDAQFGIALAMSGSRLAVSGDGVVYVYNLASATPTVAVAELPDPNTGAQNFGIAVAMDGTRVAVSAPYGNPSLPTPYPAAVYIFDIASATPQIPVATISDSGGNWIDGFGRTLGISGSRVVVGIPGYDTALEDVGRAKVFDYLSALPGPIATIDAPNPTAGMSFGFAVAISGSRVVVSAPRDDTGAVDAGTAWVYNLAGGTPTVPVLTLQKPVPTANEGFGAAVALSGSRVVVGSVRDYLAVGSDPQPTHVFDLNSATPLVPIATLENPTPEAQDQFGYAVAISGTRVVVGSPQDTFGLAKSGRAYLYNLPGTTPVALDGAVEENSEHFGSAVAFSGTLLAVGSPFDDAGAADCGSVAIYDLASATPLVPVRVIADPRERAGDHFGTSLAISGNLLVVGAPGDDLSAEDAGVVYVMQITDGGMIAIYRNPTASAHQYLGQSVAIDGSRIVAGMPGLSAAGAGSAGGALVFDTAISSVTPSAVLNNPEPAEDDVFGHAVAISGGRVLIGTMQDTVGGIAGRGRVFVYNVDGPTPTTPALSLVGPMSVVTFGNALAVSGSRAVVGAVNSGAAFVFDLDGATPTVPVASLANTQDPNSGSFGYTVSISGTRVAVGEHNHAQTGAVHIFDMASTTPNTSVQVIHNPSATLYDSFGFAVAIDGAKVAAGAPYSGLTGEQRGYAYVFGTGSANTAPSVTLTGNIPLTFEAAATYTDPGATAGDAEDGALTPVITSNTVIANVPGTYAVTWTATDSGGLTSSATRTVNVVDTTPPSIDGDAFFPTTIAVSSLLPDYRGQERAHDAVGVVSTTQSPASGAYIGRGGLFVTITVADAAGNTNSVTFSVIAEGVGRNVLVASGGEVPNDGNDPRIPAGAVWAGFGSPVINGGGYVAFLGKWTSPGGKGAGIFSDDTEGTPRLEVKVGDPVPDVPGAVWRTLSDPVYAYPGNVAWIGKISGPGITSANDTVVGTTVWSLGTLLREGQSLPVVGGARIKSVRNIAINGAFGYVKVFMDVALNAGSGAPATTTANDRAVLIWTHEDGFAVVFREGDRIGEGTETIRSYVCLDSIPRSPGHGRGIANYGAVSRWTTSSGRQIAVGPDGRFIAETDGSLFNTMPGAVWSKVGIPSLELNTAALGALKGTLKTGLAGVRAENATGIFFVDDAGGLPIARTSQAAPGIGGATFSSFLDPVGGGGFGDGKAAFIATVRGSGVTSADNTGIWLGGRTPLRLIAREGAQPPGAPAGAKWKAFTSLAMPRSIGPIFTATLQQGVGGISSADDTALYGVGSDATLFELLREGQTLDGKVVQRFTVLAATLGSQGTTRHFTSDGRIIARVEFTDHSSALVALFVP